MPRRDFNRFKHRFNKWHKHEFEEERHVDGVGDQLRVTTTYGHRRDHGVSGRRSFPSDMIRRAMAMNLLPVPSGSSPSSQNSGLGLGEIWARITIIYGISYPFNVLQELVNTAFGTQLRFYNACVEGRNAVMYAKVRQKQLLSYRKALQSIRDPSSDKTLVGDITQAFEPRLPSTPHTSAPGSSTLSNTLPEPWLEALRRCFLERFQSTTRCLDLSSLHTDPTLLSQGLYLPLNRATVVRALVSILRDNAAQLSLLNLSNNRLTQMNAFSLLACDTHGSTMVTIERIDLSCNPLGGFAALAGLQGIAGLIELDISETPLSVKFQLTDRAMAANLLKVLPGLKRLNGEDLPHSVQFAVEQTGRLPASSSRIPLPNSVLGCFPNDEVRIPLLTFLKEFFTRYDSKPRGDNLLPYYTTASQLVLSVSPDKPYPGGQMPYSNSARMDTVAEDGTKLKITLMTARLTPTYFHKSRNLLRLHNESKRKEVVARGSLACASLLDELPATEHPLESLSVDVAFHSSSQMVFTVSGVFYEVHQQSSDTQTEAKIIRKILRCFSRTMILVAPGGHIIQDDFIISNPSPPLCKKYITDVVCKNRSERTSEASSLQALTDGPDGNTQTVLLNELKQRSGMNEAFSRQCLQEYQWNLEAALNAVQTLSSAGKLPPEAFA